MTGSRSSNTYHSELSISMQRFAANNKAMMALDRRQDDNKLWGSRKNPSYPNIAAEYDHYSSMARESDNTQRQKNLAFYKQVSYEWLSSAISAERERQKKKDNDDIGSKILAGLKTAAYTTMPFIPLIEKAATGEKQSTAVNVTMPGLVAVAALANNKEIPKEVGIMMPIIPALSTAIKEKDPAALFTANPILKPIVDNQSQIKQALTSTLESVGSTVSGGGSSSDSEQDVSGDTSMNLYIGMAIIGGIAAYVIYKKVLT